MTYLRLQINLEGVSVEDGEIDDVMNFVLKDLDQTKSSIFLAR